MINTSNNGNSKAGQRGTFVLAIIVLGFLLILAQNLKFSSALRESESERIAIFRGLKEMEKTSRGMSDQIKALSVQLKETDNKLDIASRGLKASDAKAELFEKQLSEQKDAIQSLAKANKELQTNLQACAPVKKP